MINEPVTTQNAQGLCSSGIPATFILSQHKGLVSQLRRLLRRSLAVDEAEAPVIARQLGVHVRILNRRLREEDTSFRRELEDFRHEVARQLLADTMLPLSKIARAFGCADSTAFIRAFKRWSGTPPARWREVYRRSQELVWS